MSNKYYLMLGGGAALRSAVAQRLPPGFSLLTDTKLDDALLRFDEDPEVIAAHCARLATVDSRSAGDEGSLYGLVITYAWDVEGTAKARGRQLSLPAVLGRFIAQLRAVRCFHPLLRSGACIVLTNLSAPLADDELQQAVQTWTITFAQEARASLPKGLRVIVVNRGNNSISSADHALDADKLVSALTAPRWAPVVRATPSLPITAL